MIRMRQYIINIIAFLDGENEEMRQKQNSKKKTADNFPLLMKKTWILRFGNYNESQAEQRQIKLYGKRERDTLW